MDHIWASGFKVPCKCEMCILVPRGRGAVRSILQSRKGRIWANEKNSLKWTKAHSSSKIPSALRPRAQAGKVPSMRTFLFLISNPLDPLYPFRPPFPSVLCPRSLHQLYQRFPSVSCTVVSVESKHGRRGWQWGFNGQTALTHREIALRGDRCQFRWSAQSC